MSQQHVEYRTSSLTQRGSRRARLRPGDRAPAIAVVTPNGSTRLQEALRSGRHAIVVSSDAEADLAEHSGLYHFRDSYDVVLGSFGRAGGTRVWLVRPDGHLTPAGIGDGLAYLQRVCSGLVSAAKPSGPVSVAASPGGSGIATTPARLEP